MKICLSFAALALGLAASAHAQAYGSGVDGQSVFRVSNTYVLNLTASSTITPKLSSDTRVIRATCTQDCHFVVGGISASANVSHSLLGAGATEYFKLSPRGPNYVAVTRDTTDGKAYIDEMVP